MKKLPNKQHSLLESIVYNGWELVADAATSRTWLRRGDERRAVGGWDSVIVPLSRKGFISPLPPVSQTDPKLILYTVTQFVDIYFTHHPGKQIQVDPEEILEFDAEIEDALEWAGGAYQRVTHWIEEAGQLGHSFPDVKQAQTALDQALVALKKARQVMQPLIDKAQESA